jgi:hypothetical protein
MDYLSNAYSGHHKIAIEAHDLWYIVLTELGKRIATDPEKYRSVFSMSDTKQNIAVYSDIPHVLPYDAIIEHLKAMTPVDVNLFIPELSTGRDAKLAFHAALCSLVQHYYNYWTMMCGLPELLITGTVDDYSLLAANSSTLANIFEPLDLKLSAYLSRCAILFNDIAHFLEHGELFYYKEQWWKSLFKQENVGSGREIEIDGWIKDIFFDNRAVKLTDFATTLSLVPFKNLESGRQFYAVVGPLTAVVDQNGVLRTVYNEIVFEHTPDAKPKVQEATNG